MVDIWKRMRTMSLDPERPNVKSYGVVHVLCIGACTVFFSLLCCWKVINQVLKDTNTKIYMRVADRHPSNIT